MQCAGLPLAQDHVALVGQWVPGREVAVVVGNGVWLHLQGLNPRLDHQCGGRVARIHPGRVVGDVQVLDEVPPAGIQLRPQHRERVEDHAVVVPTVIDDHVEVSAGLSDPGRQSDVVCLVAGDHREPVQQSLRSGVLDTRSIGFCLPYLHISAAEK